MGAPRQHRAEVLEVDPDHPSEDVVARAAEVLRGGGLVVLPTETVYGLGADATRPAAVAEVFRVKGRPAHDPLIVHLAEPAWLHRVAGEVPELAWALARRFWPGPLTLVLPRGPAIPPATTGGRSSVAVRVPDHPVARAVIAAADLPVAAPSANRFARVSPTTAAHVLEELPGGFDLLLDAGPTSVGVESTVVRLVDVEVEVLRPGGVTLEQLGAVAPARLAPAQVDERPQAPGRLALHYAPSTPLVLVEGGPAALAALARGLHARGVEPVLLLDDDALAALSSTSPEVAVVRLGPAEPASVARRLYAALREADAAGAAVVLARPLGGRGIAVAVDDRLTRAAHGRRVSATVTDPPVAPLLALLP